MPERNALNWKVDVRVGGVSLAIAPPIGTAAAWKSILCGIIELAELESCTSTISPSRTRMNGAGTLPFNVQNLNCTPSIKSIICSSAVSFTTTFAGELRSIGFGTFGASVSSASISGKFSTAVVAVFEAFSSA